MKQKKSNVNEKAPLTLNKTKRSSASPSSSIRLPEHPDILITPWRVLMGRDGEIVLQ